MPGILSRPRKERIPPLRKGQSRSKTALERERHHKRLPSYSHGYWPFLRPPKWVPEVPVISRDHLPQLVPGASQEEALSTGKARGTPGSCHHSQSPSDVSVHSRETCFPCTASTFKPRIDSDHGGTWDSPVGKPRGKATDPLIHAKGSVTLLLQLGRKAQVHAPTRDED